MKTSSSDRRLNGARDGFAYLETCRLGSTSTPEDGKAVAAIGGTTTAGTSTLTAATAINNLHAADKNEGRTTRGLSAGTPVCSPGRYSSL